MSNPANPLRRLRKQSNLTQAQLALQANITPQVVLKAEQGLYGIIPPKLLSAVAALSFGGEGEIELAYKTWQAARRYSNRGVILGRLKGVPIDRKLSYTDFRVIVGCSVAGFCKLLCLHPAMWTRLEKEGGDNAFFFKALGDAELGFLEGYFEGS